VFQGTARATMWHVGGPVGFWAVGSWRRHFERKSQDPSPKRRPGFASICGVVGKFEAVGWIMRLLVLVFCCERVWLSVYCPV